MLTAWLDESYRAVAPATLVKQLDAGTTLPAKKKVAKKKVTKK